MVRQLAQRVAAYNSKSQKPIRSNRVGFVPKSPLSSKGFHTKHSRVLLDALPNSSARRHLKSKQPALPTIVEEEEEEDAYVPLKRDLRREFDVLDDRKGVTEEDMDWDEETTLVAMLRDDQSEHSDTEELAALADKLKGPMSTQSQQLRRYMAETIVPAIQRVKQVHDTMEEEVDMAYGTGLLAFDEKTTDSLLGQLVEAYAQRNTLWSQLEDDLAHCGTLSCPSDRTARAKTSIESLPMDVEATITRLEKKCKDMEKTSNSAVSKQKILKGLFQQLQ
ncbi:hypothetical protein PHLGIDRAFT_34773 [Phlebiopsis gigantea 11061_1 CR5-6]|uniref:Uncharacterized protein n=1 Tax=Phlebiopsis gigantea (strain 11061_1 CR5-6) TaxID=745531 RepID=A0A0C3NUB1_PHLG1|nr:hypothetical protein PHLGIDRAFT_34773 [Phlebiopsis gigantea 11061_1 CR5-6]